MTARFSHLRFFAATLLMVVLGTSSLIVADTLAENFSGPNNSGPSGWQAVNAPKEGHWIRRDGFLFSGDGRTVDSGYSFLILDAERLGAAADYTVSTKVWMTSSTGRVLLLGRWVDPQTHYQAIFETNSSTDRHVRLERLNRGRRDILGEYKQADLPRMEGKTKDDAPVTFSFSVQGDRLQAIVEGRVVLDVVDPSPLLSGTVGIGQYQAQLLLDDASVEFSASAETGSGTFFLVLDPTQLSGGIDQLSKELADRRITNTAKVNDSGATKIVVGPFRTKQLAEAQIEPLKAMGLSNVGLTDKMAPAEAAPAPAAPAPVPTPEAQVVMAPIDTPSIATGQPAFGEKPGPFVPPATPPGTPTPGKMRTFFSVRIASVDNAQLATSLKDKMIADGYTAPVMVYQEGAKFNVYYGDFSQQSEASQAKTQLIDEGYTNAQVLQLNVPDALVPDVIKKSDTYRNLAPGVRSDMDRLIELEMREKSGSNMTMEMVREMAELQSKLSEELRAVNQEQSKQLTSLTESVKSVQASAAQAQANARKIKDLRSPFLAAINEQNFTRADQIVKEAQAIDPDDKEVRFMEERLREAQNEFEVDKDARKDLNDLIARAREAQGKDDWVTAQQFWNDVLAFHRTSVLTADIQSTAQSNLDICQREIRKKEADQSKFNKRTIMMIAGITGAVIIIGGSFLYWTLTNRRRVVRIMEEALPEMALPALDLGGAAGVPQLEAPKILALPDPSQTGANGAQPSSTPGPRPAGPARPTIQPASRPTPGTLGPSRPSPAASTPEPVLAAAPPAPPAPPPAPKLSEPESRGSANPSPTTPARPTALPKVELPPLPAAPPLPAISPAPTPKKEEKPKLDLGGLPDLPEFEGIMGGANPVLKPLTPATGGPFDLHDAPTKMDIEAAYAPTQMNTIPVGNPFAAPAAPMPPRPSGEVPAPTDSQQALRRASLAASMGESSSMMNAGDGPIFSQNFQDTPVGKKPDNWEGQFDISTLEVVDTTNLGTGNRPARALKYEKKTANGQVYYHCGIPNARGRVSFEFDLCCLEKNRYLLGIYLEKDKDFRRSLHTIVHLANPRGPASLRLHGTPTNYNMGQWVHVRFDINMHRNTFSAFVDGNKILENEAVDNMPDSINTIAIRDNHPTTGTLLISNLQVYRTPGDDKK